jgi:hypothetical protein
LLKFLHKVGLTLGTSDFAGTLFQWNATS